ncbi:ErfK/YbiS/YcfS/YnhG family protein [Thermanaerovibrio acidaminovorans DSM 6589]|uniref:ErfK/YbiS/YcfS/YnhG family protein n=1 Tax=Thermanaerovibrio acidaminovorans (strain ATCC 49978 / DSM 6589 / Su883) TaxID=525903 RepID=D1B961_THEAS|nr:L,D-transpeptidase [Thermanaerovibrio acidaminovorans]ACZ18814.1 ErfK/YbiS/YcfS/YnhG family protein [Thermanaerovibrio acidaminovorans DSM 6589]
MKRIVLLVLALTVALWSTPSLGASIPFTPEKDEYWIKIDKSKLRLYLMKGEEQVKSFPVAIGRGKGDVKKDRLDLITPEGVFKVRRIVQDARNMVFDPSWFNEPGEPQKGVYGSKLISFYNPWQIAIHGTNSPSSIGKRVTHGCIRMRNRDIETLVTYIGKGTRIWITKGDGSPSKPKASDGDRASAPSKPSVAGPSNRANDKGGAPEDSPPAAPQVPKDDSVERDYL